MSEALQLIEGFRRAVLRDLLSQCTPAQQSQWAVLYQPHNSETLPSDKMNEAILLCERTTIKNKLKQL